MKICNRDYSGNHMLTLKQINGVNCCPSCDKPAFCHNLSSAGRALYWALSDDTGVSSKTLARFMTGSPQTSFSSPPSDASDRGRCIRLLELLPEWIDRLPEMAMAFNKPQDGIVINSTGISSQQNSWAGQIALIIKEGKF